MMKMQSLKVLAGVELAQTEQVYDRIVPTLSGNPKASRLPEGLIARPVHCAGALHGLEDDHLSAIVKAAASVGERSAVVCSGVADIQIGPKHWWTRFGAFEVSLDELESFCVNADFRAVKTRDGWVSKVFADWESEPREIADPDFVDGWALMSAKGTWAFASFDADDYANLAGSRTFLDAYKASRPSAIFDPILWLHGEGSFLVDRVATPRRTFMDWLRVRTPPIEQLVTLKISDAVERHFSDFYEQDEVRDLWSFFCDTCEHVKVGPDISWEDREALLMQYMTTRTDLVERCDAIWRG